MFSHATFGQIAPHVSSNQPRPNSWPRLEGEIVPYPFMPVFVRLNQVLGPLCAWPRSCAVALLLCTALAASAQNEPVAPSQVFDQTIRPLAKEYCLKCHSTKKHKGELDLERFTSFDAVTKHPAIWQRVIEQLVDKEMPPEDEPQPAPAQKLQLLTWARDVVDAIALENAGDPGRVVLRRLSNAEYTYTIRDLTGVESLDPVREFPVDGAAGEGFTNTGQSLVMSPSLVTKYLDAGKEIASHAVLWPDGIHLSAKTTRREWTDESAAEIRDFYRAFADVPADKVEFQGVINVVAALSGPEENGRLPLEEYLTASLQEREALTTGAKTAAVVARERQLNAKYLGALWQVLTGAGSSPLLDGIRARWRAARPADVASLVEEVARWQNVLWKIGKVGLLGNDGGPKLWMEPVTPVVEKQELRLELAAPASGNEVVVYLAAGDAGDGVGGDLVEWRWPRLVSPGRPAILLRDVREFVGVLTERRARIFASTTKFLAAAAEASAAKGDVDFAALAQRHGVDAGVLAVWFDYLGIGAGDTVKLDLFTNQLTDVTNWNFIKGWGSRDTPGLIANSADDQRVRVPGIMMARSVAVHPSATQYAAVGWRSPVAAPVRIEATIYDQECEAGNGFTWSLELRRGRIRQRLASGNTHLPNKRPDSGRGESGPSLEIGPLQDVLVQSGDLISVLIGPRDGDRMNDLTEIKLKLTSLGERPQEWSLTRDVSSDVLAGNPHADHAGNPGIWHFYSEPVVGKYNALAAIPAGSLLARWRSAGTAQEKQQLAGAVQVLLTSASPVAADSPDAVLHRYLTSLGGPFFAGVGAEAMTAAAKVSPPAHSTASAWGLDPGLFGLHPNGSAINASSLSVQAPSCIEIRLPAELFAGSELVTTGRLLPGPVADGSAQVQLLAAKPQALSTLHPGYILAKPGSPAWLRLAQSSREIQRIFPAALCYSKIVTTDEGNAVTLFHREDQHLADLMLDDTQRTQLDRLWDQLHYVSHDALAVLDAYEHLAGVAKSISLERKKKVLSPQFPMEYEVAENPNAPKLERQRQPINDRAAAFQRRLIETQPRHVEAVLEFADRAYRRPLTDREKEEVRGLYRELREMELPHDDAIRQTLAGVLVDPAFLYRSEKPGPGVEPRPVRDWELASRLSYFLWASAPDAELRAAAAAGNLREPAALIAQTHRMLGDPRVRHLATEFGCAWLQIHDFDHLDEKSVRHFPTFAEQRGAIYEESIRFFTDLFQSNRPVLNLLDADYSFLNAALAQYYGIPGVSGAEWRRVDGVRKYSRGGILAQAATLAKKSGAARTSPIKRGNWVAEIILGDKLPKPPKSVPQLPEDEAAGDLTVRQLTEKHTADPRCASCHRRIDAYGYALEGFDAIGRWREKDLGNRLIDTRATVMDGTELRGLDGLRDYLLTRRRAAFLHQFCRKLLGYALGRSVLLSDEPLLKDMQAQLAANDYHVGTAIEMIVRSRQFREIRGSASVADN